MVENIKEKSVYKYMEDLSDAEKVYVAWALTEYLKQYGEPIEEKYETCERKIKETLKNDNKKIEKLQKKLSWIKLKEKSEKEDSNAILFLIIIFSVTLTSGVLRNLDVEQLCAVLAASGVSVAVIDKLFDKIIKLQEKRERKIYSDLDELEKRKNLCDKTLGESIRLKHHCSTIKNTINKLIYD